MLFTSFEFIILVSVTFALYYVPVLRRFQTLILVISSLIFYAFNSPPLVLLLLWSVTVDAITSYYIVHKDTGNKRLIAATGVILNLGVLCFFKYSPMIGRTFFTGSDIGAFLISVPLPIGISFFTFQGISLMVDVFKDTERRDKSVVVARHFWDHAARSACYISFFSQLVAGPIVKAHQFMPQIRAKFLSDINPNAAWHALITGYFLKMVIADNLKDTTWWIDFPYFSGSATANLLCMLLGYSMQIFADFAGYSLIAIGIAELFGYRLPRNFDFPYISSSFAEFWRRWHMSLSGFLKEYLYIPLGGNRKGYIRTLVNIMITMTLGGLWHGARWSYAVWGVYHGILLVGERICVTALPARPDNGGWRAARTLGVFLCVTFGWLLFKLPEFRHVLKYLSLIPENLFWPDRLQFKNIILVMIYALPVIAYHALYRVRATAPRAVDRLRPALYAFMLFGIVFDAGTSQDFIYFQF